MERFFKLKENGTTVKKELLAGLTMFVTVMYIIVTNASILKDTGMPENAAILATIMVCAVSTLIMGVFAKTPFVIVPGMGINALFTYTLVQSLGLAWQEALGAVFISSLIFSALSFTKLTEVLVRSIPTVLKQSITVGIGILILFIGLQKGNLVLSNPSTLISIGNVMSKEAIVALLTLLLIVVLHIRNVKGSLLISLLFGTILGVFLGIVNLNDLHSSGVSMSEWSQVLGAVSFESIGSIAFWVAVFSVTVVVVFENMGLLYGQCEMLGKKEKFTPSFRVTGISNIVTSLFGSSPTIVAAESVTGIIAGGRTGLTAITTAVMFGLSIFLIPLMKLVPDSAVSAVLIFIGVLMIQTIKDIRLEEFSESFPSIIIMTFIPLTNSIVDGIAFGFIAYPLIMLATKKKREVAPAMFVMAVLFMINFMLSHA